MIIVFFTRKVQTVRSSDLMCFELLRAFDSFYFRLREDYRIETFYREVWRTIFEQSLIKLKLRCLCDNSPNISYILK